MNNIVEAVFGTCNPYECATRILYRYDYGMILTFPDLELPTAYEVHFSNYDDVGTTITQIGNEDGVSIPDEFLQTGLPVYCWVYLHTGEDDGETVYKVTINVKDRPQPSNGTPTPVQQDAITEAIAALDSAVEQTGADASSANADALKSEGYAVGTQDGEPVEQGSPYYRHNSLWLSQQAGQSANKAEAQASLSEAWAVGEISGHPVSSDYPQYENNSKYYAEQASHSAEDAEESAQSVLGLTADATVDSNVGTPSVSVSVTTESDHKKMSFAFHNLKGVQGDPGDTGVGISSVVLNADYTLTITLTNGTSYTTSSIRGEVGATPNLTIGTVSTLPEGSQATATITGTDKDPVLNLGIPVGDTGDPGISPTITVTEITGGHEVEVVDTQGTQTFNVMDGLDGQSGLITDYIAEEKTPYLFRPSAKGLANVISEKDMIVGGTVAWNQLLHDSNFTRSPFPSGSTSSYDSDTDTTRYSGTMGSNGYGYAANAFTTIAGHIYLISFKITGTNISLVWAKPSANDNTPTSVSYGSGGYFAFIQKATIGSTNTIVGVSAPNGTAVTADISKVNLFDLTQMFGSTIADYIYSLEQGTARSGISKVKSWGYFLKDYYPYNSGDLQSVQTSEHRMVGKNLFDQSVLYEQASWAVLTLRLIPNTVYTMSTDMTQAKADELPLYFKNTSGGGGSSTNLVYSGHPATVTSNADGTAYISFRRASGTDVFSNYNFQLEFGSTATAYEPYSVHSYPLDSDLVLRGVLELDASNNLRYNGDVYKSDGSVQRKYVEANLGDLTWGKSSSGNKFYASLPIHYPPNDPSLKMVCSKYSFDGVGYNAVGYYGENLTLRYFYQTGSITQTTWEIYIHDEAYSDATAFKTAMSGVYLVYELATPTTESADPFAQYQIVDADGTEEYVDERTVPIPVGHDTFYQQAVDVPQLPTTDGAYRLALSKTGSTATASWEYVAQAEMKAQTNILSGKYFSVGERLFVSTQAIAQGANIAVGTNCTETTLADALNQINS